MNSNMVKPKKFDHLHLVYHFTIPLKPVASKSALTGIFHFCIKNVTMWYLQLTVFKYWLNHLIIAFKKRRKSKDDHLSLVLSAAHVTQDAIIFAINK